jgi:TRAP-type C4-dicarboxylate transport system permease small subunit
MFSKIEKILSLIEETIILVCIISSLVFVFANIVLRYGFAGGFVAAEEYARYTMVLLVYIGLSQVVKKRGMIKVDIITAFIKKSALPLDLLSNILSLVVAVFLIWFGYKFTVWQYSTGQTSIGMELPLWIAYAVVPVGGVLIFIRYIVDTLNIIKKAWKKAESHGK